MIPMTEFSKEDAKKLQAQIKADEHKPDPPHVKRLKINNPKGAIDSIKKAARASYKSDKK